MRAHAFVFAALVAAAGCAPGKSALTVSVDATGQLSGIDHLQVALTDASGRHAGPYSMPVAGGSIPPTATFALAFGKDVKGNVTIDVTALDGAGMSLATGEGMADISPSHATTVTITLQGGVIGPGGDGGGMPGDMAVIPGYHLVFTTQPTNGSVNSALAPSLVVTMMDAQGMTVAMNTPVTLAVGANAAKARLNGNTTVNAVNGVATFDNVAVDRAAKALTLAATADTFASGTSTAFDVAGQPWQPVYSLNGGAASQIVFDATNPKNVVALSIAGTLFESNDGGSSWFPIGYGIPTGTSVSSIALDPKRSGVIYAASTQGMYKSTNGGNLFTQLTAAPNAQIDAFAIDPVATDVVYVVSGGILYKSSDGGATFAMSSNGLPANAPGIILIDPQAHQNLITIGAKAYWSNDSGMTWTFATTQVPTNNTGVARGGAADPLKSGTAYFGTYMTTDGGKNWAQQANPPPVSGTIVPDPAHAGTIYYGGQSRFGGQIAKTTDGGSTYTTVEMLPIPYSLAQPAIALDPSNTNNVLASDPQIDLVRSTNGGMTWTPSVQGYTCMNALSVSIDPDPTKMTLYVASSADGVMQTRDAGATWLPFNTNLPAAGVDYVAVDPTIAGRVFASVNLGNSTAPHLWIENNGTWTVGSDSGLPTNSFLSMVFDVKKGTDVIYALVGSPPSLYSDEHLPWAQVTLGTCTVVGGVAVDPTTADNVFATCGMMFFHGNAVGGFTQTAATVTTNLGPIVLDPMTPTTGYAASGGGGVAVTVYKTTNSFAAVTSMSSGLSGSTQPRQIAVDPLAHNTLYLVDDQLFKTTDGATTWTTAQAGLPSILTVNQLAIDPATEGVVYAGTNCGLYKTTTGGK